MISFIYKFVYKFKLYILGIGALLAALVAAYYLGFFNGMAHYAIKATADAKKAAAASAAAVAKAESEQKIQRVEVKVRDIAREKQLDNELNKTRQELATYKDILREKPDENPNVHLTVGDVRMLNDATVSGDVAGAGSSDPASVAAYQEQAPSTTTLRTFVGTELDVRAQYRELASRYDHLVEWVNTELIAPQLKK